MMSISCRRAFMRSCIKENWKEQPNQLVQTTSWTRPEIRERFRFRALIGPVSHS